MSKHAKSKPQQELDRLVGKWLLEIDYRLADLTTRLIEVEAALNHKETAQNTPFWIELPAEIVHRIEPIAASRDKTVEEFALGAVHEIVTLIEQFEELDAEEELTTPPSFEEWLEFQSKFAWQNRRNAEGNTYDIVLREWRSRA